MQSIPRVQYREVRKDAGNCAKFAAGVARGPIKLWAEIRSSRAALQKSIKNKR